MKTYEELQHEVDGWICPTTGLKLKWLGLGRNKQKQITIRALLPSGKVYEATCHNWDSGCRPRAFSMDNHLLQKSVEDWVCPSTGLKLQWIGWGKRGGHTAITAKFPSGEIYNITTDNWRDGRRPSGLDMASHLIRRSVEDWICPITGLKLQWIGWGKKGPHKSVKARLPSGDIHEVVAAAWQAGTRPTLFAMDKHLIRKSVEGWRCPRTGLAIEWVGCKRTKNGGLVIEAKLPSGETYACTPSAWRSGSRPNAFDMEKHLIRNDVEQWVCPFTGNTLKWVGWTKYKAGGPAFQTRLASGEIYECSVGNWRKGARPGTPRGTFSGCYLEEHPDEALAPYNIYYRRFHDTSRGILFYKIGRSRPGARRYSNRDGDYDVTTICEFTTTLQDACDIEQAILGLFWAYRQLPSVPLKGRGDTECFSIDVLGLDKDFNSGVAEPQQIAA